MPVPLTTMPPGSKVRIVSIIGGYGAVRRVMIMGLVPGEVIEVVSNTPGPVVVRVKGSLVAIGRGLARRILVEPV